MLAGASTTAGPSVSVHGWAAAVIVAGAICFALASIWSALKIIWPLLRAVNKLVSTVEAVQPILPVMQDIAHHFTPNGGTSLPQRLEKIEEKQTTAAELQAKAADVITGAIDQLDALKGQVGQLSEYTHGAVHDIRNDVATVRMSEEATSSLVTALSLTVDELKRARTALQEERNAG